MRRRAALNRQAAGVSLFPFLAVLLCTMGALIVVLVVIARQAHLQVAAAARQAETAAADGELALKQSDLEWRISELRASRDKTRRQLADKQLELSHLEEHARRLRAQLDELAKARAGLADAAGGDAREGARLRADLERLQRNATALRLEVGKLTKNGNGQETYAILPYTGPNETRRRPIYIECRAGAIVLQPDGVVLTERDFIIDSGPSNPLASALRAAREYYLNNDIRGRGEQGNPYPLLIIRPDGIVEQEFARAAIMSWGGDFGYELVAQDWPLEYPPPDPLLAAAMRQAVSEGRTRQAYLASAIPNLMRGGGGHTSGVYRASPHGGVMQADGSPVGGGMMGSMRGRRNGRPAGIPGNASGDGTGFAGYRAGGGSGGGASTASGDDNPYLDAIKEDQRAAGAGFGGRGSGVGRTGVGATGVGATGVGGTGGGIQGSGVGGGRVGAGGVGQMVAGNSGPWTAGPEGTGGGKGDVGPRYASSGGGADTGSGGGDVGPRYAGGGGAAGTGTGAGDVGPRYAGGRGAAGPGAGTGDVGPRYAGGGGAGAPQGSAAGGALNGTGGMGPLASAQQPTSGGGGTSQAAGSMRASATSTGSGPTGGNGSAYGSASGTPAGSQGGPAVGAGQGRAGGTNNQVARQQTGSPTVAGASADGAMQGAAGADDGSPGGSDGNAYRSGSSTGSYNRLAGGGARGGTGGGRASAGGSSPSQGASSSSSAAGGPSSSSNGGASGMAGQSGAQTAAGGMPMPVLNMGQSGQAGQQSVAAQRGQKNWANPDAGTTSMAVERPIRMICDSEHLTLLPETGGLRGMKVIRLGPRTEASVDDLVSAVWDRIDSWGVAGHGMYWRPKLQMIVEPGGQRRYTELQALLADSGFDVHGKPRTRETAMAAQTETSSTQAGDRSRPKARIRRLRSAR